MNEITLEQFKDFCLDHLEHFGAIPCEFESTSGEVFNATECIEAAIELKII